MARRFLVDVIVALLILLFVYAALSKILDADTFAKQMLNQPLPKWLSKNVVWGIPGVELIASLLLLIKTLRAYGLILSFLLMGVFTFYVGLVLAESFDYVPCSCGGILKSMSWEVHLVFNLGFTLLAFIAVLQDQKNQIEV